MQSPDDAATHGNRPDALALPESEESRFRTLVEAGADAVLVVGWDGGIAYANPAAAELLGRTRVELLGHPFGVPIIPGETAEVDLRRPDGSTILAEMRAVAVTWRGQPAYHASLRDITARKRAEEALTEADRRKDEFLAMLAHELRNPLAPVRTALQLLALRVEDPSTVDRVRNIIERQVGHMTRLVDDLLDVSRITRGKVVLHREEVDLVAVVRDAATDRRAALTEKGLALDLQLPDEPLWASADRVRVAQILDNLLENARKFTDGGGVTVALTSTGECAELRVRDTGVGIDPDMLPRVFDAFAQADRSLDRSTGGLGLGLAIVKGLTELHGGSVRVTSAGSGRGTEFTVTFPLLGARQDACTTSNTTRDSGLSLRILVVDDNRDAADTSAQLLELLGHETRVAYTGPEAVAVAAEYRPDTVICDIGLPGMDGYAVAAALRADPATTGARLLALTGYGRPEDVERARAAGFDKHLVKPVSPDTLLAALRG
jgi:signal transduction histidine kinase